MRILYIGDKKTHDQYIMGNVPSHWLYGAVEMERDGHDVIWAQETKDYFNDLRCIMKEKPDILFIPNLNFHNHLMLLFIASIKLIRIPIYAYLHHEPGVKTGLKGKFYRQLLKGVKHLFFLSDLSLSKTVESGLANVSKCSVPGWGPDVEFYNKIPQSDNGWYISTGKENRDFDTLIEAFRITGLPLHIMTSISHNGEDYTSLNEKCSNIPNIKVTLLNNSPDNYALMVKEMASAYALVCPLREDKLTYCVGLSTIADAEGLNKRLIITDNPYHQGRNENFIRVNSVQDWVEAINSFHKEQRGKSKHSMSDAYKNMKKIMDL